MDLMYIIILWLKNFIERMVSITSFIGGSFLPDDEAEDEDLGITEATHQGRPGKK
ncbi:MAG: hypothetical protein IKK60_05045 [Clostridia bacterium]|nr:hypothetical protein [Clostridia bacterium]